MNKIIEAKSSKKPTKEITVGPGEVINVSVGDTRFEGIPVSAYDTLVQLVREILKGVMTPEDVIESILKDPSVQDLGDAKVDTLRKVLRAINDKFGQIAINKIPHDFPFLSAEDATSYSLSSLNSASKDLLNYEPGLSGRGEIAIALLFGIHEFQEENQNEAESKKTTKSYDLVYNKQRCDVKDFRYLSSKTGKFSPNPIARLGVPAGNAIITDADEKIKKLPVSLYNENITTKSFSSQESGFDAILKSYKSYLNSLSADDKANITPDRIKSDLNGFIDSVVDALNSVAVSVLEDKYPGGFFTITMTEVKLEPPEAFEFHSCKSNRVQVTPKSRETLRNGMKSMIDSSVSELVDLLPNRPSIPDENQSQQVEPPSDSAKENEITEALIRKIIRLI
jgi:hypothetical protein